jgi:hypothetical protein
MKEGRCCWPWLFASRDTIVDHLHGSTKFCRTRYQIAAAKKIILFLEIASVGLFFLWPVSLRGLGGWL